MPSSPNYVRDYTQEYKTAKKRGDLKRIALRNKARRAAMKKGLVRPFDGKDIDHKVPLSKGGSNATSNQRVVSAHDNRSFPRNKDGSLKKNT